MKALLLIYPGDRVAWLAGLFFLQSTGVIALAWLVARCAARRRPALRHGIWFWALASLLLGLPFAMVVERAGLSFLRLPSISLAAASPTGGPAWLAPPDAPAVETPPPAWTAQLPIGNPGDGHARVAPRPAVDPSRIDRLRAAFGLAFLLWALGSAFLLARLAVGGLFLGRLKRAARPLDEEPLRGILVDVQKALHAERLPRILISDGLDRPVAAGILRAVVILPETLVDSVDPQRLRDVLVHECAHVERRDHLVGLLQRLAEVAFWPQPLVRLLNRELSRAREELCDNHVLRGGDPVAYSWTLLEIAEIATGPAPFPTAFGLLSSDWRLEDRIAGILDDRRDLMTRSNRRASFFVTAGFLATTAALSGLGPAPGARGAMGGEPGQDGPGVSGAVDRMAGQLKQGPIDQVPDPDRLALFLLDVEKGDATLITDEPDRGRKYVGSPRWSSDGRRILFDASPGNDWPKTRLKSIDLTEERLKISDLGPGNCPAFSPDGRRIAFLINPGASPGLDAGVWMMQSDGSNRTFLGEFGIPKWSPDGRQLLIVHFGSPVTMEIMDVETRQVRPIQIPGYKIHSSPSWAAPGTLVASASSDEGVAVALFDVTNPDEGKVKEVLWKKGDRLDASPAYPVFSPVTRRCVFVAREAKGSALYSVQQGSFGPPKRLEPQGYDDKIAGLEFSPDGRYLLFCSNRPDRRAHAADDHQARGIVERTH